jgi:hypothetical protein
VCDTGTGACSNPAKADGAPCSDGDACTQTDSCLSGSCSGGNPKTCSALDQCHDAGTCNPVNGVCSNPAKADGSSCSDGNVCTQTDACANGACLGSNPIVCPASDQCHEGLCNPGTGACSDQPKADGSTCEDGNPCTVSDTCQGGACNAGPAQPPADVNDSVMLSQSAGTTTIAWTDAPGPFNVYRGSLASGAAWAYNQTCLEPSSPSPASDSQSPSAGDMYFYLVSRKDACGESAAGRNSLGAPDPNPAPCP